MRGLECDSYASGLQCGTSSFYFAAIHVRKLFQQPSNYEYQKMITLKGKIC